MFSTQHSKKGTKMKRSSIFLISTLLLTSAGSSIVFAADGIQEVQTDSANSQKQALQKQYSTPAPSVSASASPSAGAKSKNAPQQNSGETNYQKARDWRPKTVQTCVKGGISLQLKKSMTCPKGFVKK